MKKLTVLTLSLGLLLGATACGNGKNYAELETQAYSACWDKSYPTVANNIATGFVTKEDGEGKLARTCIAVGKKAVEDAKAADK